MNFIDKVKKKIDSKLNPENIILIDNSSLHAQHKSFRSNKTIRILYCDKPFGPV